MLEITIHPKEIKSVSKKAARSDFSQPLIGGI